MTGLLLVCLRNICYNGHHRKLQETQISNVFWNALYGILQLKWYWIKQYSQLASLHPRRMLGSLAKDRSCLFSDNIFGRLKKGLNFLDIIISLYPKIRTELNSSACLSCQCYYFKSVQKQGVHCKLDILVGYRNVSFKTYPSKCFFKMAGLGTKVMFFDIIYGQVAQITYGKSSHETYYTHNHPSLRYMFWWEDKTCLTGGNELRWEMSTVCGSISTCKLPKHGELRVNLRSLHKYWILLPKAEERLQLVGALNQRTENTNLKQTGDFESNCHLREVHSVFSARKWNFLPASGAWKRKILNGLSLYFNVILFIL